MHDLPSGSTSSQAASGGASLKTTRGIFSGSHIIVLAVLLVILVLGAGVRMINLDAAPIWWDEGNNAFFAHTSPGDLLYWSRITNDTDPPAHRLALGVWLNVLGDSATKIRLFSVLMGLATVVVAFLWGRWLVGALGGLLAALLTAFSPMAVYYSREAKGYPMVACFALLALYLWFRYLRNGKASWLVSLAFVVTAALALSTHYYAVFLFVVPFLFALSDLIRANSSARDWGRFIKGWLVPQIVVLALVAPWLLLTVDTAFLGANTLDMTRPAYDILQYFGTVLGEFAAGPNGPAWTALLGAVVLCGTGIYAVIKQPRVLWPLVVLVVVCLVLAFFVQLRVIFFNPRFLFYVAPALYVIAAIGIVRLKWLAVVPVVCLGFAWGGAFSSIYQPLAGPEEDLRPIAQFVQTWSQPDDVMIVSYIWQEGALRLYAPGHRSYVVGTFEKDAPAEGRARALLGTHPRAWLLTYKIPLQTPVYPGPFWFESNAARALVKEQGNNRLVLYLAPCAADTQPGRELTFTDGVKIRLSSLPAKVAAGTVPGFATTWSVDAPLQRRLSLYMHVVDASQKLVAQQDGEPVNFLLPISKMEPGRQYQDCRALALWPDTQPGRYQVLVGVYDAETKQQLMPTNAGSGAIEYSLGELEITPYVKRP
jgi:hypothetical protein